MNPFTTGTWNQAAVYLNGKIYKFAGSAAAASTNVLEIYDIGGGGWTLGAPYPLAISFVSAWAQGGFIYAAGGIDSVTSTESLKTYRYDPVANTWDDASIADLPATRWGAASTFYNCCPNNGGILAGGYSGGSITNTAIIWDLASNSWSALNQMVGERTRMNGAVLNCNFYVVGGRSNLAPNFVGTNDNQKFTCPCPTPTPTPTPTPPPVSISGTVIYCSNTLPNRPVPGVTMTLTGTSSGSQPTDSFGNYTFSGLPSGGNYTVTPTMPDRAPGSVGINGQDVLAVRRHILTLVPLTGCRLTAADVNGVFPPGGNGAINAADVTAIQKFILTSTPFFNVGKYKFTPFFISYTGIVTNQTAQNFTALVFGDVASTFIHRPEGPSQTGAGDDMSADEVAATVAAVGLPEVAVAQSKSNFIAAVRTSAIDAKNKLVGFQGDFTFDERVVTFQSEPVQKAGITGGNWNVSGNVLAGTGPIRTLRILAYSDDFTPLSGEGTLFELRMTRVSQTAQGTPLLWAAPPDQFIFIDADLKTQKPVNAASGSVTTRPSQR